ncbi:MAG TPA: hypothetical protein VGL37_08810 [Solirubrobacteraceae bacterium]|jgi:hypothetical protein
MSDYFTSDHPSTDSAAPAAGTPSHAASNPQPPDVSLLLRAHAERRWLSREVIPVLRQLESCDELPDEQLPAACAYLEFIWTAALARARETDAERRRLDERGPLEQPLLAKAHHYHATVCSLREAVARRVALLLAPASVSGRVTARSVR